MVKRTLVIAAIILAALVLVGYHIVSDSFSSYFRCLIRVGIQASTCSANEVKLLRVNDSAVDEALASLHSATVVWNAPAETTSYFTSTPASGTHLSREEVSATSIAMTASINEESLSASNQTVSTGLGCITELAGRLYYGESGVDPTQNLALVLFDAFLHPEKRFAYVLLRSGDIGWREALSRYPGLLWNCTWLHPLDHHRALYRAQEEPDWMNRTTNPSERFVPVFVLKFLLADTAQHLPDLLLNLTAFWSGGVVAHFGLVRVCTRPLSSRPLSSILCTGCLRSGANVHSHQAYSPDRMDAYMLTWVDYHLRLGFEKIMMYFEDADLTPITRLLQRFIDAGRLILVPSHFRRVSLSGAWSPLLALQEAHCLHRAKGLAKWVGFNDVDEFFEVSGLFTDVNDLMERVVASTDYVALAVGESRWFLPWFDKRPVRNYTLHQCQELCSGHYRVNQRGRNKWLLHADRVFAFSTHYLRNPGEHPTKNFIIGNPFREVRLVHLRWIELDNFVKVWDCPEMLTAEMLAGSYVRYLNDTCPDILHKPGAPPLLWPRRRRFTAG